ncbi:hypothetical protein C8R46DRAFT_610283 [Mycena filopes]|nr:hypothetical protein C8R46DRAFT_610283 [Mycena filopes]
MALSRSSTGETVVNGVAELWSPAIAILDAMPHVGHHKKLFNQLARDAGALAYAAGTAPAPVARLDALVALLYAIDEFIKQYLAQTRVSRVLTLTWDTTKKIDGFRAQIKKELNALNPDIFFHMSETTEEVRARVGKLQERLGSPPIVEPCSLKTTNLPMEPPHKTDIDYHATETSTDTQSIADSCFTASSATDVAQPDPKDNSSSSAGAVVDVKPVPPSTPPAPTPFLPPATQAPTNFGGARGTFILGATTTVKVENNYLDSSTPALRPENLELVAALRKIMLANRKLISILGVALAFREPPSVLQIARVLEMKWEDVAPLVALVAAYLDRLDTPVKRNSNVRIPHLIQTALVQRTGALWVEPRVYHTRIARWCLVGQRKLDARDIAYCADYWAEHVCESPPSVELQDGLKASTLPLQPDSYMKLAGVSFWLEQQEEGEKQARELLERWKVANPVKVEEIEILGGALKLRV